MLDHPLAAVDVHALDLKVLGKELDGDTAESHSQVETQGLDVTVWRLLNLHGALKPEIDVRLCKKQAMLESGEIVPPRLLSRLCIVR